MNNKLEQVKQVIAEHLPPARVAYAKLKFDNTSQQLANEAAERYYYNMLHKVKQLLKNDEPRVFEKHYTQVNSQNAYIMHSFITDSLYLYMECDCFYKYQVEFAFNNCKHEEAVRELLNNHALQCRTKEVALVPDFNHFYVDVLAFKPETFVYTLKAN